MRTQIQIGLPLALVALLALAGCGTETLNASDIESDINSEYSGRGFDVESVSCPDDIEAKAGETGECSLTANGVTVPVEIEVTSEDGAYDFEIPPDEAGKLEAAGKPVSGELPQLSGDRLFLTDGGLETTLIFHEGIDLPSFAAFDLLKDEDGREALRRVLPPVPRARARARDGLRARHRDLAREPGLGPRSSATAPSSSTRPTAGGAARRGAQGRGGERRDADRDRGGRRAARRRLPAASP